MLLENLNLYLELADFKKLMIIDPPSGVNVNVLSPSQCECRRLHCLHTELQHMYCCNLRMHWARDRKRNRLVQIIFEMDINAGLEYLMKEKSIRSTYVPVDLLTCAIMEHTRIVYWTKTNKYQFKVQFWNIISYKYEYYGI